MSKLEFLTFLKENGYTARLEKNCVMVISPECCMKELEQLAHEHEYEGSYGWRHDSDRDA